jgi:ArsR family transcriptional regulator
MKQERQLPQTFCASRLKVLADTTRLAVLEILMDGPRHVGELNAFLGLEQSLLSHHLKVLRKEGFVEATREGKAVLYRLAPEIRSSSERTINLGCCLLSFEAK